MVLDWLADCISFPCFFGDVQDAALWARPVFVYVQWLSSAGATSSRPIDYEALPRMLRCHLVLLVLATIGLLFDHLVEGVVDVPAFAVSAAQLLSAAGALATLNAPHRRLAPSAALRKRRARLLCLFVWLSNACLILDVVFSAICVVSGHQEAIVSVDLAMKVGLFLFVTSLPFFALDRELAHSASELTFVWKIWTIEAVDFCTILYGTIDYAQSERKRNAVLGVAAPPAFDPWEGVWSTAWRTWSPALQVYVAAFILNAILFGALASWVLVRALTAPEDEHIVDRGGYMFVATYVFVLDAITDLPVWFASLVTRAYVHNLYLTFNVIVNLLALVRGIYICLVACLLPLGPPPGAARRPTLDDSQQMTLYGAVRQSEYGSAAVSRSPGSSRAVSRNTSSTSLSRLDRATSAAGSSGESSSRQPPLARPPGGEIDL